MFVHCVSCLSGKLLHVHVHVHVHYMIYMYYCMSVSECVCVCQCEFAYWMCGVSCLFNPPS